MVGDGGFSEGKMAGDGWRLEGLNDSGWSEGRGWWVGQRVRWLGMVGGQKS
jgi:hypothetical protein